MYMYMYVSIPYTMCRCLGSKNSVLVWSVKGMYFYYNEEFPNSM